MQEKQLQADASSVCLAVPTHAQLLACCGRGPVPNMNMELSYTSMSMGDPHTHVHGT